ncbi:mCG144949, partial [Mus musculus]
SLGLLPFFHNTSSLQSGKKTSAANLSRLASDSSLLKKVPAEARRGCEIPGAA